MIRLLIAIDARVLQRCTRIAHSVQRATGLTSFFIARCSAVWWFFSVLLSVLNYFHQIFNMPTSFTSVFLFIPTGAMCIIDGERAARLDREWRESMKAALPAWLLVWRSMHGPLVRMWVLTFCCGLPPLLLHDWLIHASWLELACDSGLFGCLGYCYFMSVDPLPPGVSRVRAWLEKFHLKPIRATA
jgi:hypothetical protein